jgi:Phage gp6-like head-tail connector protein
MQQLLNVLTPSSTYDLVTLDEMKMKLGIPTTDTSKDALLSELITNLSDTIAKLCNRVFAYEGVDETFYQLNDETNPATRRLYLSRWPVVLADITAITQTVDGSGVVTDLMPTANQNWFLEELTGTLYMRPDLGPWMSTVEVIYSGGYQVPDGVPGALKFCVEALLRESYMSWIRNPAMFGVRQLSHKESRIGYYAPTMFPVMGIPATWTTVESILKRFIRYWV